MFLLGRFRIHGMLLCVEEHLQIQHGVVHIVVQRCYDLSKLFSKLTASQNPDVPISHPSRADSKSDPVPHGFKPEAPVHEIVQGELFAKARNYK
jgi:error-prone DNA polymerase